jgi:hypothetical protein
VGEEIVEVPDVADMTEIEEIEEFAETALAYNEFSSPQSDPPSDDNNVSLSNRLQNNTPQPYPPPQLRLTREASPPSTSTMTKPHSPSPPTIPRTPRSITSRATTPRVTAPLATSPRATTPRTSPPRTPSTPGGTHRVRSVHNVPLLDLHIIDPPTKSSQQSPPNINQVHQITPKNTKLVPDTYNW